MPDESTTAFSTRINDETYRALLLAKARTRRSLQELVDEALREWLARQEEARHA